MNWNKVLNVFIVIFLVINVFLFFYHRQYATERYMLSESRYSQLQTVLESNGILLYKYMPTYTPMSMLVVNAPEKDREAIVANILGSKYDIKANSNGLGEVLSAGDESLTFYYGEQEGYVYYKSEGRHYIPENFTDDAIEKVAGQFAADIFGEDVDMEVTLNMPQKDVDGEVVGLRVEMNEKLGNNTSIFQTYIKLYITRDGVEEALAVRFTPVELENNEQKIHAFDTAMYNLMYFIKGEENSSETGEPLGRKINDIHLGYYIPDVDNKKLTYEVEPHYRIVFENGDTYYVNAYTNAIIKP